VGLLYNIIIIIIIITYLLIKKEQKLISYDFKVEEEDV